jgi:hypothetical protein
MGKLDIKEQKQFLKPFPKSVQDTALWLRNFVWDLHPDINELVYDNYNAVVFGFGLTDKTPDCFCSVAVYPKYVNFGFLFGTKLADPDKLLKGAGKLYRYIQVKDVNDFPQAYIKKIFSEAYRDALTELKDRKQVLKGATIIKSVSVKKRRPA